MKHILSLARDKYIEKVKIIKGCITSRYYVVVRTNLEVIGYPGKKVSETLLQERKKVISLIVSQTTSFTLKASLSTVES